MSTTNNNIYTNFNVKFHGAYGKLQSYIMTFGINKGYFISAGIALISVAKVIYEGYLDGWENINYDINTLWPFALTIGSTMYTTVSSVIDYSRYSYKYSIIQDDFYKHKVINKIQLSEKQIFNGYSIKSFYNGKNEEKFIMSNDINIKLMDDQSIKVNILNYKFQLVDEIKKYVPSILKRNFMSDKLIFNGKLIRMARDLYTDRDKINVQKVGYFDGQCSPDGDRRLGLVAYTHSDRIHRSMKRYRWFSVNCPESI